MTSTNPDQFSAWRCATPPKKYRNSSLHYPAPRSKTRAARREQGFCVRAVVRLLRRADATAQTLLSAVLVACRTRPITGDATGAFRISRGDHRTRFELWRAIVWCRAHEAFSNCSPLNHSGRRRRRSQPGEQRSHHVHEQASERASSVGGGGATRRAFAARFYTRPRVRARCAIAAAPSRPPRGIVQTSARPLRLAAPRRVEDAAAGRRVVERRRGAARRVAAERAWNGNGTLFHRLPTV